MSKDVCTNIVDTYFSQRRTAFSQGNTEHKPKRTE